MAAAPAASMAPTPTPSLADPPPISLTSLVQQHVLDGGGLSTLAYVPDYLTMEEEARMLREVHASRAAWTQLSGRRLQNHGGVVHPKGLLQTRLPGWLTPLMQRLHQDTGVYGDAPPNHVLVNAYMPGEGIMPHEDGPSYWPGVCILSLGAPAVIRFWRKRPDQGAPDVDTTPDASLVLMPRSLLIFAHDAYTHCLHGIRQVQEESLDATVLNLSCHPGLSAPTPPHPDGGQPEATQQGPAAGTPVGDDHQVPHAQGAGTQGHQVTHVQGPGTRGPATTEAAHDTTTSQPVQGAGTSGPSLQGITAVEAEPDPVRSGEVLTLTGGAVLSRGGADITDRQKGDQGRQVIDQAECNLRRQVP